MKQIEIFGSAAPNYAIISDIHLGIKSNSLKWFQMQSNWLETQFLTICKSQSVTDLLILGDLFDNRETIDIMILQWTIEWLQSLVCNGINVIMIAGNHDIYAKHDTRITSLSMLELISGVTVLKTPTRVKWKWDNQSVTWGLIPWTGDTSIEAQLIDAGCDWWGVHCDALGLPMNGVSICEHGLDASKIPDGTHVWSGHIHKWSQTSKLTMLGSPYAFTWSDSGDTKGFYIISQEQEKWVATRHINTECPAFVRYGIDELHEMDPVELQKRFTGNVIEIGIPHGWFSTVSVTHAQLHEKWGKLPFQLRYKWEEPEKVSGPVTVSKGLQIDSGSTLTVVDHVLNEIDTAVEIKTRVKHLFKHYLEKYDAQNRNS
jgi:hypothetical protein